MSTPTATARLGTANDGAPVVSMNKIGTPRRETTFTANGMRSLTPTIDRRTIALSVSGDPNEAGVQPLWTGLNSKSYLGESRVNARRTSRDGDGDRRVRV